MKTLATTPFEHIGMDYERLRSEGLRLLERLAGERWTDFNTHDPGITILEQMCYAITELGYRIDHDLPDLLAEDAGAHKSLPGPALILPCEPVTAGDLRRLVLDVEGVRNAWIEDHPPECPFYYYEQDEDRELRLRAEPHDAEAAPIELHGLQRVLVHEALETDVKRAVAHRLHSSRSVGQDWSLEVLDTRTVRIDAEIEIGPVDDAERVMLEIHRRIDAYFAPTVEFSSLTEGQAGGRRVDELYEGPALARGFIDQAALSRAQRRDWVYTSDLIQELLKIDTVRAVRSIELSDPNHRSHWSLDVGSEHVPVRDEETSDIRLLREGLPIVVNEERLEQLERQSLGHGAEQSGRGRGLEAPRGRKRSVGAYRSFLRLFPALYGVGALGLSESAPTWRKARAKQLKAYLLLLDQVLANSFAQLAHAGELLSYHGEETETYFSNPVHDPELDLDALRVQDSAADDPWREGAVGPDDYGAHTRKNRFLNHLLARFAEQLGDHALVREPTQAEPGLGLAADKRAFLRKYSRISSGRGLGVDIYKPAKPSGLQERIRLSLGLEASDDFCMVEHILLRPIAQDLQQRGAEGEAQVPLLAAVESPDPYSFQVSFVFRARPGDEFRTLVEQTLCAQAPAHMTIYLHWLDDDGDDSEWKVFVAALGDWHTKYREYRRLHLGGSALEPKVHLEVRDARDRLIDLLGFGQTYPLRDVPTKAHLKVTVGTRGEIPIEHSQRGVLYQLHDHRHGTPIEQPEGDDTTRVEVMGDGGTVMLITPPIDRELIYDILAVKVATGRQAYLHEAVTVEVGLDLSLVAEINAAALDPNIEHPTPTTPRVITYGQQEVKVSLFGSQEGIEYELVDAADADGDPLSVEPRTGDGRDIDLELRPVYEDVDLRIRATKVMGTPDQDLLDTVLPLRVRANPALAVEVLTPVVAHGLDASVRLQGAQASAEYRFYEKRIRGRVPTTVPVDWPWFSFVNPPPGQDVLEVDLPGRPPVLVVCPPRLDEPQGLHPASPFQPAGEQGVIVATGVTEDVVMVVQARKQHANGVLGSSAGTIDTEVMLEPTFVVLTRPDHARPIHLRVWIEGQATTDKLAVLNGEPGVFYKLRAAPPPVQISKEAYVHERDDEDDQVNRGIGQLRITVDLAVARDHEGGPPENPVEVPALPPVLAIDPLPVGTTVWVDARKALTGVETAVGHATIDPVPTVVAQPAVVAVGGQLHVTVQASRQDEHYRLVRSDGELVPVQAGTGGDLVFEVFDVQSGLALAVMVTRSDADPIVVERLVAVNMSVTPLD